MKGRVIEIIQGETHFTPEQLAQRWSMAVGTLANWRVQGWGPRHIKLGLKVRYPREEVESWERKLTRKSTVG